VALARSFLTAVQSPIRTLLMRYRDRSPELHGLYDELKSYYDAADLMNALLGIVAGSPDKLYVLIDEYGATRSRMASC